MEEKHKDLIASKQKSLINTIVAKLSELHPSLYYSSTSEIAYEIERYINSGDGLSHDETEVLKVSPARLIMGQRVMRDEVEIFRAKVTVACVTAEGRPQRLPAEIRALS